jgi:hypothetical protein
LLDSGAEPPIRIPGVLAGSKTATSNTVHHAV